MIVSASERGFRMTTNDEHGRLTGYLASRLSERWLPDKERANEFVLAAAMHDCGWIGLDEVPLWNDGAARPFSVADHPLGLRLPFYRRGIDEVQKRSAYAALLCSMHYTNLPPEALAHVVGGPAADLPAAIAKERERQRSITMELSLDTPAGKATIAAHHRLLQLTDALSLYLCACTEDGGDMAPMFAGLLAKAGAAIVLDGLSAGRTGAEVTLSAPLFAEALEARYTTRDVPASLIAEQGIAAAYAATPLTEVSFTIVCV